MSLLERILRADKEVFKFIQLKLTAAWLDGFMLVLRNPYTWIPLYLFLVFWILRFEKKIALRFILISVLCVTLTDYSCAHLFKPFFGRLRPVCDPEMTGVLRGLVGCSGRYSFPSNHAANHFGLASLWFFSIQFLSGRRWYWLWIWASLISFAQVYVGLHFPVDVSVGALYGSLVGFGLSLVFRVWNRLYSPKSTKNSSLSLH